METINESLFYQRSILETRVAQNVGLQRTIKALFPCALTTRLKVGWYTAAALQTLDKELTINIYEMMQSTERHEEVSLQLC